MPEKETLERARKDKREGKAPSTQAGEFVREEIEHIREGKHGARSTKQAIAIGLAKARRAGVDLPWQVRASKSIEQANHGMPWLERPARLDEGARSGGRRRRTCRTCGGCIRCV